MRRVAAAAHAVVVGRPRARCNRVSARLLPRQREIGEIRSPERPSGGSGRAGGGLVVVHGHAGGGWCIADGDQDPKRSPARAPWCARHVVIVGDLVEITSPVCGHGMNQINAGSVLLHARKVQSAKNRASEVFEDTRILLPRALVDRSSRCSLYVVPRHCPGAYKGACVHDGGGRGAVLKPALRM